jgi:uncharacterized protein YbjT (DUF2867 family)
MPAMTQHTTLVLGATGKTGRRVLDRLNDRGVPTRAGSRSADPPFDWQDRSTWAPALEGVDAVYISYFPDLAIPGAADTVRAFAELAAGRRLVLISGRGEEEAQRTEELVRAASPEATIVRASWFSENFSENYLLEDVLEGVVALPVDGTPEPFVDADDIADVAVAALTEDGHAGEIYEVTGSRLLSFAEAVREIADATGRDIRFQRVPMEDYEAALVEQDVPQDVAWLLRYLFTEVLDGRNAQVTDGVQRALGRPPRDFRDFARETAATGVWG